MKVEEKKTPEELRRALMKLYRSKQILDFFREMGRLGGKKGGSIGGKKAAKNMTPEERRERARKAAAASAKVRSAKARKKRVKLRLPQ